MKEASKESIIAVIVTAFLVSLVWFIVYKTMLYSETLAGNIIVVPQNTSGNSIASVLSNTDLVDSSNLTTGQKKLQRILNIIDSSYLYEYDEETMVDNVATAIMKSLDDPYAVYYNKEAIENLYTQTVGNYVGIGIYVTYDTEKKMPVVIVPLEGSPAEEVGLTTYDYIEYVGDMKSSDYTYQEIIDAIKGEAGTKVKIGIIRYKDIEKRDEFDRLEFEIERRKIDVNPVTSKIYENNIGYIRLTSFDQDALTDFTTKYKELIGNSEVKGLIVDLRDNPGGVLEVCTTLADMFVPEGKIVSVVDKNGKESSISSDATQINIPLVVLVNKNSASASELFTAAIKDYGVGTVIGETTYGKGVVQTLRPLYDGSYIKLTTQEYFSGKGTKINKIGVTPDIEVSLPEKYTSSYNVPYEDDTQLQKGIEVIKDKINETK